ncbi:MAG TPA: FHA domain-containing protein [Gammaproteobacteria bacterium]|nr:FHA domain-containing protein [Gammaproteobacteria bacterium]
MYREFFQLDDYPFRLTADTRYFFMGESHARAIAYLNYLLHTGDGIGVVTGEPGLGKSVVIEHVLTECKDDVVVARIRQSQLTTTEFFLAVCLQFDLQPDNYHKATLIDALHRFVNKQHFAGKKVLLVVDEAHLLQHQVLEELRMLASFEKFGRKLISVILVGAPELEQLLNPKRKDALSQQMRMGCRLEPLSEKELDHYLEYRMWIAGGEHTVLFPEETLPLIMRYTGGVPRLVNVLCDMALVAAFMRNTRYIDNDCIKAAVAKLGWKAYEKRLAASVGQPHPAQLAGRPVPRIVVMRNERVVGEYMLEKDRVLIGRHSKQDIMIRGAWASRYHAQIIHLNGKYYLQDLNSKNGTYVGNELVSWYPLSAGDRFQIGGFVLEYQLDKREQERRPTIRTSHPSELSV